MIRTAVVLPPQQPNHASPERLAGRSSERPAWRRESGEHRERQERRGDQKWHSFEAHQITPFIAHSPLVSWLIPAFGVRGAGFFLGMPEIILGTLILLGFWNHKFGIIGALGSIVTFLGTVTIIPFLPNAWAREAGGFPAMYLPVAFLMKDVVMLAVSIYLLRHDVEAAAAEI